MELSPPNLWGPQIVAITDPPTPPHPTSTKFHLSNCHIIKWFGFICTHACRVFLSARREEGVSPSTPQQLLLSCACSPGCGPGTGLFSTPAPPAPPPPPPPPLLPFTAIGRAELPTPSPRLPWPSCRGPSEITAAPAPTAPAGRWTHSDQA